jgi:hypothetical protein
LFSENNRFSGEQWGHCSPENNGEYDSTKLYRFWQSAKILRSLIGWHVASSTENDGENNGEVDFIGFW